MIDSQTMRSYSCDGLVSSGHVKGERKGSGGGWHEGLGANQMVVPVELAVVDVCTALQIQFRWVVFGGSARSANK